MPIGSLTGISSTTHRKYAVSPTGSLFFNGNGYVSVTSLGSGLSSATSWTIECWVYLTSLPTSGVQATIFAGTPSPDYSPYYLCIGNTGSNTYPILYVGNGTSSNGNILSGLMSATSLSTGWNHFAVTYSDSSGYVVWQNGNSVASNSTTTNISSIITSIQIGSYQASSGGAQTNFANNYNIASLRISNALMYTTTFAPSKTYSTDVNTFYFFPFTGATGSTGFEASVYSGTSTAAFVSSNAYIASVPNLTVTLTGNYTASTIGSYNVVKFTSGNGTFNFNANVTARVLVVGGGGSGGNGLDSGVASCGGGGGAGGLGSGNLRFLSGTTYSVIVGNGGGIYGAGANTKLTGGNISENAYGGGAGGAFKSSSATIAGNGGSGGGSGATWGYVSTGGFATYGSGNLRYIGNSGGSAPSPYSQPTYSLGGGGASKSGVSFSNYPFAPSDGGSGFMWIVDGTYYSGGGGGAASYPGNVGNGGMGGGGNGSNQNYGDNASPNTGGGGGGNFNLYPGGRGGSGIVAIAW